MTFLVLPLIVSQIIALAILVTAALILQYGSMAPTHTATDSTTWGTGETTDLSILHGLVNESRLIHSDHLYIRLLQVLRLS